MSNTTISPEILDKYLAGECTAEETRKIEAWYAAQKGEKDFLSTVSDLDKHLLEEMTLKKIKTTIGAPFLLQEETPVKLSFWRNRVFKMGIAASFALICWAGWSLFQSQTVTKATDTLFGIADAPIKQDALVRFVNKETKLKTLRLPDGTAVCMHPNAELTYPKTFEGKTRQVIFIGEGFFDVAHDSLHPFMIQSDKMQIRVLGTKFSVKALPKQAIFQVSVVSGSVAVRSIGGEGKTEQEAIILKSQQKALFEVATNQLTTLETVAEAKKEIFEPISINFNDAQLSEVVKQLEMRFNVHIELSDKALSKCLLTADFNNQSLPVILEILCASLDVTYALSNDTLILKGGGCD
jgi:transmembrane sensor